MPESALTFGPFVLDPQRVSLQLEGREVAIGHKGLALFEVLLEAAGGGVRRETLLERAWSGVIVEESNLTVQIATLRKALGTQTDGQEWIATVQRVGTALHVRLRRPPVPSTASPRSRCSRLRISVTMPGKVISPMEWSRT